MWLGKKKVMKKVLVIMCLGKEVVKKVLATM
jgi:hypothetical protein